MRAQTQAQRPLPRALLRCRCGAARLAAPQPAQRTLPRLHARWRVAAADGDAVGAADADEDLAKRSQRLTGAVATMQQRLRVKPRASQRA
jgi:hypothetical protein